jgi:hypothetical protein
MRFSPIERPYGALKFKKDLMAAMEEPHSPRLLRLAKVNSALGFWVKAHWQGSKKLAPFRANFRYG